MESQVIEFIVENTLPEDALVGVLLQSLWGTLKLVKYQNWNTKWDLQQNERIKDMHINIMVVEFEDKIKVEFEILNIIFYSTSIGTIANCFQQLLTECLNKMEKNYQHYCSEIPSDIRRYPVFQVLENLVVFNHIDPHVIIFWMNVKLRMLDHKRFNLEVDNVEVGNFNYSRIESLMKLMIQKTLPEEFYSGLPIQRIKSARNK
jgi:hypothetical protein